MSNNPSPEDFFEAWSCINIPTRPPAALAGTDPRLPGYLPLDRSDPTTNSKNPMNMEWQVAQVSQYYRYIEYFSKEHPDFAFVLAEAEYKIQRTEFPDANDLLKRMTTEFRNWRDTNSKGGSLRPDMLGLYINPQGIQGKTRVQMGLELLEVTTEKQWKETLEKDVNYKLKSLKEIAENQRKQTQQVFYVDEVGHTIGPGTWKPTKPYERYTPLPLRLFIDPSGQAHSRIEWICFNPTFRQNDGLGIDGLLLYEVHTVDISAFDAALLNKVAEVFAREERRAWLEQHEAQMLLPPPWLTREKMPGLFTPEEQKLILYGTAAIGLPLLAYFAVPAIVSGLAAIGSTVSTWAAAYAAAATPVALSTPRAIQMMLTQMNTPERIARCGTVYSQGMQQAIQWHNVIKIANASSGLPALRQGVQGGSLSLH